VGGLTLPNLERLGLGRCAPITGVSPVVAPTAAHGTAEPRSPGKDSTTGHWELCGLVLPRPFATYPNGFPVELLAEFSRRTGRGVLGNRAASGTVILDELGGEHVRTGDWIVYTSADGVFQVAAHEDDALGGGRGVGVAVGELARQGGHGGQGRGQQGLHGFHVLSPSGLHGVV
jgi:phosphopentomutase